MDLIIIFVCCGVFLFIGYKLAGWIGSKAEANPNAFWASSASKVSDALLIIFGLLTIVFLIIFSGDGSVIRP